MRAPTNILRTKLYPPKTVNDHVHRVRLLEKLNNNYQKNALTLVSAPAGYGKSYLVSCWLNESKIPYGWISLSEDDNDLRTFLEYLVAAVEKVSPEKLEKTSDLLQAAELPPVSVILNLLINELDEIDKEFVLVLDDYHLIKEKEIHDLIDGLLQYPPDNMVLCIITRRDPPLKIGSLRAYNRMSEIRMEELSFTVQEILVLYKNMIGLGISEEMSENLLKRTEGWVAGLRLTALSVKTIEQLEIILKKMKGENRLVTEYLIEEVLASQPEEYQKYLMKTSLLDRFCADVVEVLDITESTEKEKRISGVEFIEWLEKTNLFVIPLDDEHKWFRYHHEFQKLLQKQLKKKRSPEQINTIYKKASEWFEKEGFIDEAIQHFLLAKDIDAAAVLVEQHAHNEFLYNVFQVEEWLKKLPSDVREQRPKLLLINAWIAYRQLHMEKVPPLLDKIGAIVTKQTQDPLVMAEISFFQGNFLYWMGAAKEADACIKLLKEALTQVEKMPVHVLSNIELLLNMVLQKNGKKEKLIPALESQIKKMDKSNGFRNAFTYGSLAFVNLLSGNLFQSKKVATQMQVFTAKTKAEYLRSWSIYMHALANFHLYELNEAADNFKLVVERGYGIDRRVLVDTFASLALLHHFKGENDLAAQSIIEMMEYASETNDLQILFVVHAAQARLALLQGNHETAFQWAESFKELPIFMNLFLWQEVPWITQAKVLITKGSKESLEKAVGLIEDLFTLIKSSNLDYHLVEIKMLMAMALDKLGQSDRSLDFLQQAVVLANSQGCIRPFVEAGFEIEDLLKKLLNDEKESMYIKEILKHFSSQPQTKPLLIKDKNIGNLLEPLTTREIEILSLLSKGLKNREIGDKIFLAQTTIKKHIYNIYQKLDVHSRIEVVTKAKELNIIS